MAEVQIERSKVSDSELAFFRHIDRMLVWTYKAGITAGKVMKYGFATIGAVGTVENMVNTDIKEAAVYAGVFGFLALTGIAMDEICNDQLPYWQEEIRLIDRE